MQREMRFIMAGLVIALTSLTAYAQQPTKNSGAALTLAQNGKSNYVIALAVDATPAEKTAARELSEYLEKISSAKFSVQSETTVTAAAPQILVGAGVRVKSLLLKQDWKTLGSDGIVIKTSGKNLRPSARFAVCGLLFSGRFARRAMVDANRKSGAEAEYSERLGAKHRLCAATSHPRSLLQQRATRPDLRDAPQNQWQLPNANAGMGRP